VLDNPDADTHYAVHERLLRAVALLRVVALLLFDKKVKSVLSSAVAVQVLKRARRASFLQEKLVNFVTGLRVVGHHGRPVN
jgi:hypothetical protein